MRDPLSTPKPETPVTPLTQVCEACLGDGEFIVLPAGQWIFGGPSYFEKVLCADCGGKGRVPKKVLS